MTKRYMKYKRGSGGFFTGLWSYEEGYPGHIGRLKTAARLREPAIEAGSVLKGGPNLL